jgi:DNA-binding XRE family transcriptional regulator
MPPRPAKPPTDPFWRDPLGLDVAQVRLRPGSQILELRYRGGQAYRLDLRQLGLPSAAAYAVLDSDPRVVVVGCSEGETVDLGVEQLLAACDPAFRDELAARSVERSSVGARLRALRLASGRTALDVAAASGMARSNYARLEADWHDPRLATLVRVAKALGVPLSALVGGP